MSDLLSISVDASTVLAALERLGARAATVVVKAESKVTADRIEREARRRVRVRTGRLRASIEVREDFTGEGYIVGAFLEPLKKISLHRNKRTGRTHTQKVTQDNLPLWIEFGTKFMTARPFLFASARLEEGPHLIRLSDALQEAIDEVGLG